jgi:hypothetical protein
MKLSRRLSWLCWLGLFVATAAFAQVSGTITSTQCVQIGVGANSATVAVQIAGTWSGTLQPQITVAGGSPANTQVTPSTSSTAQSTITANGIYTAGVAGASSFQICGNTVASGTASVILQISNAVRQSAGGGGGGVTTFSGDGTVITNSGSTGAVTVSIAGTSGGVPYFNGANSWASSTALTANAVVLGGGAGAAPTPATGVTVPSAGELDAGTNGGTGGTLGLNGATSGKATISAPAVAGTATNPIVFSNAIQSATSGATATPSFTFSASTNSGMYFLANNGGGPVFTAAGADSFQACNSAGACFPSTSWIAFSSGTLANSRDTSLNRQSAGLLGVGSGSNTVAGSIAASSFQSRGTTFTSNAGCGETSLAGGATAGKFTANSTSCTIIVTMGNTATAPNGWDCHAMDLTTLADVTNPHQTATTTTTATFVTGTIVSGDVISFHCVGY